MTVDLVEQLARYGQFHEERQEPLDLPSSDTVLLYEAKREERPRLLTGGSWAFVSGVAAVVLVGSLALLWGSQPEPAEFNESSLNVTTAEWFDQVVSASNRLGDSGSVLVGSFGPLPEFDTSRLGEEQSLDPVSDVAVLDWPSSKEESSRPGPLILAGAIRGVVDEIGGPTIVGVVKTTTDASGVVICTGQVSAVSFGRGCDPETAQMEFGAPNVLFGIDGEPDVLIFQVPTGSSVVATDQSGTLSWQRPIGSTAALVGDFRGASVEITIYDKKGSVILSSRWPLS